MRKVRITKLPKKEYGGPQSKSTSDSSDGLRRFLEGKKNYDQGLNQFSAEEFDVNHSIKAVPREEANVEAEHNEIAVVPGQGGIPESYKISGKRHPDGGVPLNLAPDSFIFSDHKKGMKIKDKEILAEFGMSVPKKGRVKGYTPAEIAKKYDLNDYKKILLDPNSDKFERETAEKMIENYNLKLAKLGLVQESMKGFPQGIPEIATPYIGATQMDPSMFMPPATEGQPQQAAYGAGVTGDPQQYSYAYGGQNKKMSKRFPGLTVARYGGDSSTFAPGSTQFTGKFWDSILQDGGEPTEQDTALLNYLDQQGAVGDTLTYGKKPVVTTESRYSNYQYEPEVRGKNLDQVVLDRTAYQADSVVTNPNFPSNTGVAWINGKPVVVPTEKKTTEAGEFQKTYGAYKSKGTKNQTVYPAYDRTPYYIEQNQGGAASYQVGGETPGNRLILEGNQWFTLRPDGSKVPLGDPYTGETSTTTPEAETAVETAETPTGTYNVPAEYKDDPRYDESSETYDPSLVAEGDYVKKADGKWYKATGLQYADVEATPLEGVPEAYREDYSRSYALLKETFSNPDNAAMTDKFYKNYQDRIGKAKMTDERKAQLQALSKQEVIDNFLKAQEQIYTINTLAANDPDLQSRLTSESMDRTGIPDPVTGLKYQKNEAYADILKGTGVFGDEDVMSDDEIAAFQGAYQGFVDLSMDDQYKEQMKRFNLKPVGMSDEEWDAEWADVSPVDDWFGNTTIGQAAIANKDVMGFEEIPPEEFTPEPNLDTPFVEHTPRDEWWAQDIGNIANLFGQRVGLQKYLPHSFPVDLARPDALYFDPSRALAANAEQSAIAARAVSSFAGPQATYKLSGIAGESFKNAANVLADYEAKNVGIGNQYLNQVQQTSNQEAIANSERAQRLFDQTTVANQQFDNSKRMTSRNLFEGWRQGLTNKKMTQAMNTLYPQFETIPSIGGGMYYTGMERPLQNTGSSGSSKNNNYLKEFEDLKNQYPDASDSAIKQQLDKKYTSQPASDPRREGRNFMEMMRGMHSQGAYPPGMNPTD